MATAERPILFSAQMIRGIMDGSKTQTRRIMKPQPEADIRKYDSDRAWESSLRHKYGPTTVHICPFGQRGTKLWVRETWCPANSDDGPVVLYKADSGRRYMMHEKSALNVRGDFNYGMFPAGRFAWDAWAADVESGSIKDWRPSLHMPRWASRIMLEISDVRVELLQDITEDDARAEGATRCVMDDDDKFYESEKGTYRCGFAGLWSHINGAGSWDANPYVWSIAFRRIEKEQR